MTRLLITVVNNPVKEHSHNIDSITQFAFQILSIFSISLHFANFQPRPSLLQYHWWKWNHFGVTRRQFLEHSLRCINSFLLSFRVEQPYCKATTAGNSSKYSSKPAYWHLIHVLNLARCSWRTIVFDFIHLDTQLSNQVLRKCCLFNRILRAFLISNWWYETIAQTQVLKNFVWITGVQNDRIKWLMAAVNTCRQMQLVFFELNATYLCKYFHYNVYNILARHFKQYLLTLLAGGQWTAETINCCNLCVFSVC